MGAEEVVRLATGSDHLAGLHVDYLHIFSTGRRISGGLGTMNFAEAAVWMVQRATERGEMNSQIEHFLRVGLKAREISEEAGLIGLMHDMIEDGYARGLELLSLGLSPSVVADIRVLTRREGQPYGEYISQIVPTHLPRLVKIIDCEDNIARSGDDPGWAKSREKHKWALGMLR